MPDLRDLWRRLETTFVGRCVVEFVALQGIDRAVVIASQAFTALIPLLLLVSALAPQARGDVVATALVDRFHLRGDAANAVQQLFAHAGSAGIGVFSAALLLFSGVSLARRLQRMYQQAWRVDGRRGINRTLQAALGLITLVIGIGLLYGVRRLTQSLPVGNVLVGPVSALAGSVIWVLVPWLLLGRRVGWRRLVPAGVLTAACTVIYGLVSIAYIPRLMETYSRRYGLFGVTLALVGFLLCIAVIIVAATAVGAELDRAEEPWARRVRQRLGVRPAADGTPRSGALQSPSPAAGSEEQPAA